MICSRVLEVGASNLPVHVPYLQLLPKDWCADSLDHGILQDEYQQSLAQNSALKQQEQTLRETAAFLKDCLLQHNSSSCSCKCLHQFNKLRAENIARGIVSPGGKSTS